MSLTVVRNSFKATLVCICSPAPDFHVVTVMELDPVESFMVGAEVSSAAPRTLLLFELLNKFPASPE